MLAKTVVPKVTTTIRMGMNLRVKINKTLVRENISLTKLIEYLFNDKEAVTRAVKKAKKGK